MAWKKNVDEFSNRTIVKMVDRTEKAISGYFLFKINGLFIEEKIYFPISGVKWAEGETEYFIAKDYLYRENIYNKESRNILFIDAVC